MGYWKDHLIDIEERGYGDLDKAVCAGCITEPFISKKIKYSRNRGKCSYCGRRRNVLPMDDVLKIVVSALRKEYESADLVVPWDSDIHDYAEHVPTMWETICYDLNDHLLIENEQILNDIVDLIRENRTVSKYRYILRPEDEDLEMWKKYCRLVKESHLSAEQIVSLDEKEFSKLPDDINYILSTLHMVVYHTKNMRMIKPLYGFSSRYKPADIYRCVNYLGRKAPWNGLDFISANMVGTAPAKLVSDNRMSESGDMMFYGAADLKTASVEVGKPEKGGNPSTIGTFNPNKMFRVLDLTGIESWKLPSIFDVENAEERSRWFFLKEFTELISKKRDKSDELGYKPTQVLTKYIQRKTGLQGIMYNSSKVKFGNRICYVLFVTNRNCIDEGDKRDSRYNQLIMKKVEQHD
ncbi:HEPN-associated N-terminal domain-containing protein [Butyrivibrio fibrisolvens]|uniref:HEPN-associated N-terminal domain-containing protein n=1 Tax=Butyrivibrio fibrisolvens TaxID=831 RepID=UPI0004291932|nr:HEPN-associated N-terminal domain-containing protein [Butyrivibrio fibrisolvens]